MLILHLEQSLNEHPEPDQIAVSSGLVLSANKPAIFVMLFHNKTRPSCSKLRTSLDNDILIFKGHCHFFAKKNERKICSVVLCGANNALNNQALTGSSLRTITRYSRLSLSQSRRDPLIHFEISVLLTYQICRIEENTNQTTELNK